MEMQVKGLDEFIQRLDNAETWFFEEAGEAMSESVDVVHTRLSEYTQEVPPKPKDSKYIRTFELMGSIGKGWTALRDKIVGWATSDLDYAPLVMGEASQVPLHRGRWWTQQDVAEEKLAQVRGLFAAAMQRFTQRIRG